MVMVRVSYDLPATSGAIVIKQDLVVSPGQHGKLKESILLL